MTVRPKRAPARAGRDAPMAAPPAPAGELGPAAIEPPSQELRRLGAALGERVELVISRTVARSARASRRSGHDLDANVRASFERIGRVSTTAVAEWMAGGNPRAGGQAGEDAWQTYGQLAAQRAVSLNELTKRCLRWRDSVVDVLREAAAELGISEATVHQGAAMVQLTLDVTLVRICEYFESERKRVDEELMMRQQELAFAATHDALTGLPNRPLIMDRSAHMLVRARRNKTPLAALFIDIDNFKNINDTLGHAAGDELLLAIAARLDGVTRGADALGRLGGDEFVVIAGELSLAGGPEPIAERLLDALKEPFELATEPETSVTVTASVGIVLGDVASATELLRAADIAMRRAKAAGKNRYLVFESGMEEAAQTRTHLEMDLQAALGRGEFFLVYQPTFDLHDMRPTGMEALIRWQHPARGIVPPNEFVPTLEETGMIADVGRWVLEQACLQAARWQAAGSPVAVAVNVSGRQLDSDELIECVRRSIEQSGLDPHQLTLEITETALMHNVEDTAGRLTAIKQLGVRVAIDDFGTGYSSLAHLQQLPVDALKIDRSFIQQLTRSSGGAALIHTLVQLGKALSIETLAEGIEQQSELALLQREQCDSGQGFLFARPLEADTVESFLRTWQKRAASR